MHVWYVPDRLCVDFALTKATVPVRRYVEGTKEPTKLLDLLSAAGSDDIEPTKARAAREALYPEVRKMISHRVHVAQIALLR